MEGKVEWSLEEADSGWNLITITEDIAVTRFREYLRIKTVQPDPDYASCTAFLKKYGAEIGLEFSSIEVFQDDLVRSRQARSDFDALWIPA